MTPQKTIAKQIAEKDKYMLVGQYRGTAANVISLGAYTFHKVRWS